MTEVNKTSSNLSNEKCAAEIIHTYPCTQLKDSEVCLLKNQTFAGVVLLICTLGLIGNGTVFWLLGFRIKRNFFSVYVWNLAIADFGVLTAVWSLCICVWSSPGSDPHPTFAKAYKYLIYLFVFVQCSSIHFLTAISVDRCLVILFPVWHRCRRPKNLSAVASLVLWGISCIILGLLMFSSCWKGTNTTIIISFAAFVSVMVISTVILFVKVCCNSRLRQHGKVHIAILLSLLFFIFTTIPISLFVKLHSRSGWISPVTLFFTCMNSSINPVIYFITGRCQSFGQSGMSIKDVLQWFFKEEEDSGHSPNLSCALRCASYKNRPPESLLSTQASSCPPRSQVEE